MYIDNLFRRSCCMHHGWPHRGGYPSLKILVSFSGNKFRSWCTHLWCTITYSQRTILAASLAPTKSSSFHEENRPHLCLIVLSFFLRSKPWARIYCKLYTRTSCLGNALRTGDVIMPQINLCLDATTYCLGVSSFAMAPWLNLELICIVFVGYAEWNSEVPRG